MIITNVCLLLEALSIVICLHHLYGEKFRLDIATVSFLSVDMIIMTAINYFGMPKTYTMVIYPIVVLYCRIRFRKEVKALIINFVLCAIIVGIVQYILMAICFFVFSTKLIGEVELLMVNAISFSIIYMLKFCKLNYLSLNLQRKEKVIIITIIMGIIVATMCYLSYKSKNFLEIRQYAMMFIGILMIHVLV